MKAVTSEEMRRIDRETIEGYGIPGLVLMERAGLAVSKRVEELGRGKIIVLCGTGNNGGDGLVAARDLHNKGYKVKVFIPGKKTTKSKDFQIQLEIAKKTGVTVKFGNPENADLHGAIAVDAIFGTGLKKEVTAPFTRTIGMLNDSGIPVLSVDMPSGISSDSGRVMGVAVKADYTVTFGLPKRGHFLYPGAQQTGKLYIEDIGFPSKLLASKSLKCNLIERNDAAGLVPERRRNSHKGDYGHVLILAGSRGKTGAALMAAKACLGAGAGLVTIGAPEQITGSLQSAVFEEMILPLPDTGGGELSFRALDKILGFVSEKADVLAVGPGIGVHEDTIKLINEVIPRCAAPMLIDADGLNALKGKRNVLRRVKAPVVLTPHPGEFSRLTGGGVKEIEADRIESASSFSKETGVYIILKGVPTVIAEPGGETYINQTGNPGMAKAGTGDVLTGMVASFLGQGLSPLDASVLGVYMHGLAGDIASSIAGEHSVLSSDIIESIGGAFKQLARSERD